MASFPWIIGRQCINESGIPTGMFLLPEMLDTWFPLWNGMQTSGVIGPSFIVCSGSVNGGKFVCLLFFCRCLSRDIWRQLKLCMLFVHLNIWRVVWVRNLNLKRAPLWALVQSPTKLWYSFERCNDLAQLGSFHKNTYTHPHTTASPSLCGGFSCRSLCLTNVKKDLAWEKMNTVGFTTNSSIIRQLWKIPNFSKLSDDRRISRETDGYNENCLGVRFALCIIKALRLARIEHCSGTVVTPFLPSEKMNTWSQSNPAFLNSIATIVTVSMATTGLMSAMLTFRDGFLVFFWLWKVRWAWRRWTSIISVLVHDQVWPAEIKCWSFSFTSSPM